MARFPIVATRPALVATLLVWVATAACARAGATELLCAMRTGETTATLRVAAGDDPLAPSTTDVGEHFEVRAIALRDVVLPDRVDRAAVTVLDRARGDGRVTLSQSRMLAAGREALGPQDAWRPNLSGWARVYSPALGRELAWGCALVQKGASPQGWDRADATSDPQPLSGELRRVATSAAVAREVRLAWMGDVMLADGPGRVIARGRDPFASVAAAMRQADVRIANLECVVANGGRPVDKPWTFRANPRALPVLQRHVDVVSLANNHSGDFGPKAFGEMLQRLDRVGLPYFGGGRDLRAAHRPAIIERQGLRIALLGYNEMFPRQFEAGPDSAGIAWADEEQIVADIRAARALADVVIPYMHWGQEHSETAHARQRALARLMIHAGADAVVGTHPHVRQDTEMIDGKPVIYSLGNFVFDGFSDPDNNTGSILWMTVSANGVNSWELQSVHIDASGTPHVRHSTALQAASRSAVKQAAQTSPGT